MSTPTRRVTLAASFLAIATLVGCSSDAGSGASNDGDGDASTLLEDSGRADDAGQTLVDGGQSADDAGNDAHDPPDGGPKQASKCAGSSFRVCDGFESGAIDTKVWGTTIAKNATVTIDAMHVARGDRALHVHTGVSGGDTAGTNGGVRTSHGFPFPGNQLWGRAFVYMANDSPDAHTNLIEAVGQISGGVTSHYRIGVTTKHVISGNYIPGDYADRSATVMPLDTWKCFEWHFDGQSDEYHFYVDGNELTDMAITSGHNPAWTAPAFAYVEIGLHLYHDLPTIPALDVWYDEIALDTARIGCAN